MVKMKTLKQTVWIAIVAVLLMGSATGCNSKKKAERQKAETERYAKISQARMDLEAIINGEVNWTLDEQQERIDVIKSWNLNDTEIDALVSRAEAAVAERRQKVAERLAEQERIANSTGMNAPGVADNKQADYSSIEKCFKSIIAEKDVHAANDMIAETIKEKYASPNIPVLIIISKDGVITDYERPIDIETYLHYLKDSKNLPLRIENAVFDSNGKITELQVVKNLKK